MVKQYSQLAGSTLLRAFPFDQLTTCSERRVILGGLLNSTCSGVVCEDRFNLAWKTGSIIGCIQLKIILAFIPAVVDARVGFPFLEFGWGPRSALHNRQHRNWVRSGAMQNSSKHSLSFSFQGVN